MSTRQDFASFAAYTPRRMRPLRLDPPTGPSTGSYQAGGVPTFGTSIGGGAGHVEDQMGVNEWETRFGWRVDVEAAVAYLGGPVTALLLLILETSNDFVRFHAYQSALLLTPLLLLRGFAGLVFPSWLQFMSTMSIVIAGLYMAFKAFRDANGAGLSSVWFLALK
ncbi:hypothetical protein OPQ81_010368 [Rhizoctonia solani]|nr:hypothetical protein OPQ81_010368 [Rhizoctonia solani]